MSRLVRTALDQQVDLETGARTALNQPHGQRNTSNSRQLRLKTTWIVWAGIILVTIIFYAGSGRSATPSRDCEKGSCWQAGKGSELRVGGTKGEDFHTVYNAFSKEATDVLSTVVRDQRLKDQYPKEHKLSPDVARHTETSDGSIRCRMSGICDVSGEECHSGPDTLGCVTDAVARRQRVVTAIQWAWRGYRRCAWGRDELKPISCSSGEWFGMGLTLVDSLDTLILAGLHDEVEEALRWVEGMDVSGKPGVAANTFECTIRMVGGLLSAAHLLHGDQRLLKPAVELALRLLCAFNTPSGIPYSDVNLADIVAHQPHWTSASSLSEATTLSLEFCHIARAASYPALGKPAMEVWRVMSKIPGTEQGLAPMFLEPGAGLSGMDTKARFSGSQLTLGARSDSYYEYMLKQYILGGMKDEFLLEMYKQAMQGVRHLLVAQTAPLDSGGMLYIGERQAHSHGHPDGKMDHLVCFLPGVLALGHYHGIETGHAPNDMPDLELAEHLMQTCYNMYHHTPSGIAPELVHFSNSEKESPKAYPKQHMEDVGRGHFIVKQADSHNLLRPETVESLFILWRVTNDTKYTDWGWQIFRAFEMHTRFDRGGYTNLESVLEVPPPRRDKMESFFIAETLKYLLLLFSPHDVMPLDQVIFNTEAHPLPILDSELEREHSAWYLHAPEGLPSDVPLDGHSLKQLIEQFRRTW